MFYKFMPTKLGIDLKFVFCEDWFIYAIDRNKNLYYVNTEFWVEWGDLDDDLETSLDKAYEKGAIKKYMLPVAFKQWHMINWHKADSKFTYIGYWLARLNLRYNLFYRWLPKQRKLRRMIRVRS